MSAKVIIIVLALCLLCSNAFAQRLPTEAELIKYCIGVKLSVDNQIHYFAVSQMTFSDLGFSIRWGQYGEHYTFYGKENILNWDEVLREYKEKKE